MKVLLITHHMFDLSGSETAAYTIGKALVLSGCDVTMYSPYLAGEIAGRVEQLGVPLVNNLEQIKDDNFDIIHVSHNVTALEARRFFPETPMILQVHGVLPFLEQPPKLDLNISKFLAVSEEVERHLIETGIDKKSVGLFRNIVDTDRFRLCKQIDFSPTNVLVISRKVDAQTMFVISEACNQLNLKLNRIGDVSSNLWDVPNYINEADIVVSLGRGIIEGMACGRAALVLDYNGGDGMVTRENFLELQKCNFSGRRYNRRFGVQELVEELKKYDPTMQETNRRIVEEHYSSAANIDRLLSIYREAIAVFTKKTIAMNHIVDAVGMIAETRTYSFEIQRRLYAEVINEFERRLIAQQQDDTASLNQAVAERDAAVEIVSSIRQSNSWKITAPLRLIGQILSGDFSIVWRVVRYIGTRAASLLPKKLLFFLKRQFSRISSLSGYRADSTANSEAIDAIVAERWAFMSETSVFDPFMASLSDHNPPNVDIGVVTYNSSRWIEAFVESLLTIDYPKSSITIRFVDNGSSDTTVEGLQAAAERLRAAGYTVEILQRPNRGFGAGHNVAIKAGSAPFCLVTNIDLTFERDTLSRLVATALADKSSAAAWEARQKPYEHPKFYDPVTGTTNWNSHACVLLRRSALELAGCYDEALFMYGEDVELSYRLRRAGFLLRYCPAAVVMHYSYENSSQLKPLQYTGSTYANLYIRLKYGNRIDALSVPLMGFRLLISPEVFPGSRRAVLRNLLKLAVAAPKALLSRRRSTVQFPFRGWDYELVRNGAFVQVPPLASSMPLVSVITRTYRGREAFLREALLSVAHQTYQEIEHLVVEDGGDTMREVVEGMSVTTGRNIRFIALDKVGRSAAGNMGLKASSGRWCLFLDDDDLLFADHLEVLVNALQNNPDAAVAYTLAWDVVTDTSNYPEEPYREVTHKMHPTMLQDFNHKTLATYNLMPIQAVLFRRSLYGERGGLPEDMEALEDWVLWNRYAFGNRFIYVPKLTSMFRTPADPERLRQRQDILNAAYPLALVRIMAGGQLLNCQGEVPLVFGR